jgi:hypothetical protein
LCSLWCPEEIIVCPNEVDEASTEVVSWKRFERM